MDPISGPVAGTAGAPIDLATWGWDDHLAAAMPADASG